MSWPERAVEYLTLTALVVVAFTVAFCAEDARSLRTRLWTTRCRWAWAATDVTTTSADRGRVVTCTSTRQAALRLLRDAIGDL